MQGNEQITLKAHFRNYLRDPEVVSCSTIYQALQSLGILHSIEEGSFEYQFKGECAYHINQRSHTTDECIALKTKICEMINTGKIRHMWGPHTMLACDQVKPGTPITKDVQIYRLDFTAFEERYTTIYQKLVDAKIIYTFQRKKKPSKKHKDEETCPYHSREVRNNIEECRIFRIDFEHLIQTGNIWVEFPSNYR
ncbi:hypothetical protein HAX54_053277 [Datura stramonium]|uniref:Uncharacterized protein n=1 Tax=Datura stramonium TaxID=4076 RepID=A0ABS8T050_DATST|nr:hypothetical protein [Datura stramonium]